LPNSSAGDRLAILFAFLHWLPRGSPYVWSPTKIDEEVCCKIVTVYTKSEPPSQVCFEYGQHFAMVYTLGGHRSRQPKHVLALRCNGARKPIEMGITITPDSPESWFLQRESGRRAGVTR
jgi:hypothetical protein